MKNQRMIEKSARNRANLENHQAEANEQARDWLKWQDEADNAPLPEDYQQWLDEQARDPAWAKFIDSVESAPF